jgi:hypothetical protein
VCVCAVYSAKGACCLLLTKFQVSDFHLPKFHLYVCVFPLPDSLTRDAMQTGIAPGQDMDDSVDNFAKPTVCLDFDMPTSRFVITSSCVNANISVQRNSDQRNMLLVCSALVAS